MTNPPLFGYPSISEPEVAAAVRLLLTAGDNFGAELATLTDDPNMTLLVRGLAALADWWGAQLYGSTGALNAALATWQDTGELPPTPAASA